MKWSYFGLHGHAQKGFYTYLSCRTKKICSDGLKTSFLLNGPVCVPLLLSIYIKFFPQTQTYIYFYADDVILYARESFPTQAMSRLQSAYNILQTFPQNLKVVLNAENTKCVLFSRIHNSTWHIPTILKSKYSIFFSLCIWFIMSVLDNILYSCCSFHCSTEVT